MSDQPKNNSFSTLIIGIVLGAAVTYLLTNKNGQKVKDRLIKEGEALLAQLGEGLEEAEEKIEANAEEIEEGIAHGLEKTKDKLSDAADQLPKHITDIQKKGRRFFFRKGHNARES
ncbi:hypothetical protein A3F02_01330 [Candidatus Curtissbacteria bacterium RIFCSPHIGHO2_12_FULL_38_9b]|uniref:YtxH domain-containing protein n=2 Tax=Candidatus Curtissiibacteriota TaxID=1752717 RepID=A0A1F5H037_9BACT|nr:MAG: hypothetical protein A3A48_00155 [Candidatus Curtissbacteria bacterium RIFCSPLOWO2_01_FULL_37_9]OGD97435.1 MAG: hypothetical protein A3F02_01330 [Candidatus Curtissbacteria bacterium RIFCSPHIGHO2_12_FULL_38_9b]